MKSIVRIAAVMSSVFCLTGGAWILSRTSFTSSNDALATAIGCYFVGKAFFVGPMLWITAEKFCAKAEEKN